MFATQITKQRVRQQSYSQWRWHLGEAFIRIGNEAPDLWRALDHEGEVREAVLSDQNNSVEAQPLNRPSRNRESGTYLHIGDGREPKNWLS